MMEPKRILFIAQEINPYLPDETPMGLLNRQLPEYFQSHGFETRTFMPKLGEINERRNQLHEVIRLSGMNIIVDDSDHPLLLKVASIQSARIQIYFVDNDDFFGRRKGILSKEQNEYSDHEERVIFYARSVLETVRKLRWTPDVIYCSGWMTALIPMYLKLAYIDTPFFTHAKVVLALDDLEYVQPFSTRFAEKLVMDGVSVNDVRSIDGFPVGYEELMRLAIDYADAIIQSTPTVNQRVFNYAQTSGKPLLPFQKGEENERYMTFCQNLLQNNE